MGADCSAVKINLGFILAVKLFVIFLLAGYSLTTHAALPNSIELSGYAWSSNIGWISFNCSDLDVCSTSNYGVIMKDDYSLSGYAWNDNIGWIKFGGLSGFPAGGGNARLDLSDDVKELVGWARACAGTQTGDCSSMTDHEDGWDGWISLNCSEAGHCGSSGYGVRAGRDSFKGFAWGAHVVGWVDMSAVTYEPPCSSQIQCLPDKTGVEVIDNWCRVTVRDCTEGVMCESANPLQCLSPAAGEMSGEINADPKIVYKGNTSTLTWSAENAVSCKIMRNNNEIGTWLLAETTELTRLVETSPIYASNIFRLLCENGSGSWEELDSVEVKVMPEIFET